MADNLFGIIDRKVAEFRANQTLKEAKNSSELQPQTVKKLLTEFRRIKLGKDVEGLAACRAVNDEFTDYLVAKGFEAFTVYSNDFKLTKNKEGKEVSHVVSIVKCADGYYCCDGTGDQLTLPDSEKIMIMYAGQTVDEVYQFLNQKFQATWAKY